MPSSNPGVDAAVGFEPPQERLVTMPEGLPDKTLGYEALAWAARYLSHPNGIRMGKPWQFTREQARFILWFYAVDDDGRWLYSEGVRRLAKGSGKSPFSAVMALVELLAPVRFDRFDDSVPGGVVGRPQPMPLVQLAAVALDQTENAMRHVRAMVNPSVATALHRDYQLDVGKTQIFLPASNGKLEVITSSVLKAEGGEATFVVADETEHWLPSNGGVELMNTLKDNLSKSANRMLQTLNAWKPGLNSAAEKTFTTWVEQQSGLKKEKQPILYDSRMAPPDTDMGDHDSLTAALEFVYADCPWIDTDAIINRIWSASNVDDSKRKYLNWPVASSDSWVDPKAFAMMHNPDRVVQPGEDVVLFFDGSISNDHTALVGCCMSDGHVFTVGVWKPVGDGDSAPRVDVRAVDAAVKRTHDRFNVVAFFADVREWESFTKIEWPELFEDTIQVWAKPGGRNPEMIAWDMRTKDYEFTAAAELCADEIMKHGFTHDGHPMLVQHVNNARRYDGRYGVTVRKESPKSQRKIDACVCMIGARMVWKVAKAAEPVKKQRTGQAFFL